MENPRFQSYLVFTFPLMLSIGIVLIPVVPDYSNHAMAARAVEETTRWFTGHILSAAAFGLSLLSVDAIGAYLRNRSYRLPDFIRILLAIGAGLYAAGLGADGIGPVAVRMSGANPQLFFDGSGWWINGTFIAATIFFGIGLISLAGHVNNAQMIQGFWRYVILVSAILFAVIPAIPSGWGLLGQALASIGAFFPLGFAIVKAG